MADHTTNLSGQAASKFVAVDWGSSNFRLLTFSNAGVASVDYPDGIATLKQQELKGYLDQRLRDHNVPHGSLVLMCGMVGSRAGWIEAPYLEAPLELSMLGERLVSVPHDDYRLLLVPGVKTSGEHVDVMRGEEVQALGWCQLNSSSARERLCLPGTHSKWLKIESGRVVSIETALTGELYENLCQRSLLVSGEQAWSAHAFSAGVERARQQPGILRSLFSTRARVVAGNEPASAAASYLSGLLIGTELLEQQYAGTLHLVGQGQLLRHYGAAAQQLNMETRMWDGTEMVGQGFEAIWRQQRHE